MNQEYINFLFNIIFGEKKSVVLTSEEQKAEEMFQDLVRVLFPDRDSTNGQNEESKVETFEPDRWNFFLHYSERYKKNFICLSSMTNDDGIEDLVIRKEYKYCGQIFPIMINNMECMFPTLQNLKSISFEDGIYFEEEKPITSLYMMCDGCRNLKSFKFPQSGFYLKYIKNMGCAFADCRSLKEVIFPKGEITESLNIASGMFRNCNSLEFLDLSMFSNKNLKSCASMFQNCRSLKEIKIDETIWDLSKKNVIYVGMWDGCPGLPIPKPEPSDSEKQDGFIHWLEGITPPNESIASNLKRIVNGLKELQEFSKMEPIITAKDIMPKTIDGFTYEITHDDPMDDPHILLTGTIPEESPEEIVIKDRYEINGTTYETEIRSFEGLFANNWRIKDVTIPSNIWMSSDIKSMKGMFQNCTNLVYVSFSESFDLENVTDMSDMFHICTSLEEVYLPLTKTSSLENTSHMFYKCLNLKKINLAMVDFKHIKIFDHMFSHCENLEEIFVNPDGWKIPYGVKLDPTMFEFVSDKFKVTPMDLNEFKITEGTLDSYMKLLNEEKPFYYIDACAARRAKILKKYSDTSENSENEPKVKDKLPSVSIPFQKNDSENVLNQSSENLKIEPTDWEYIILKSEIAGLLDVIQLNHYYGAVKDVVIHPTYWINGRWYRTRLESMKNMFKGHTSIETVTFEDSVDVSKLTSMRSAFDGCTNLRSVTFGESFTRTKYLQTMGDCFHGCTSLISTNVNIINTEQLQGTAGMFRDCKSLATVGFNTWNTPRLTTMDRMFYGCENLSEINFGGAQKSKFTTTHVTGMKELFHGCKKLYRIEFPSEFRFVNNDEVSDLFEESGVEIIFLNTKYWNFGRINIPLKSRVQQIHVYTYQTEADLQNINCKKSNEEILRDIKQKVDDFCSKQVFSFTDDPEYINEYMDNIRKILDSYLGKEDYHLNHEYSTDGILRLKIIPDTEECIMKLQQLMHKN